MSVSCHRTGILLERRASGLEAADGLLLERHLESCPSCRVDARLLSAITGVARAAASMHDRPARAQAMVERAMAVGAEAEPPDRYGRRRLLALAGLGVAAAAGIALLVYTLRSEPGDRVATSAGADRVLSGEAVAGGGRLEAGATIGPGQRIETSRGAVLALGPGRVQLQSDTAVVWSPRTQTVVLESGSVQVDVDSIPDRQFRVEAARFAVVVAGTRFRVDETGVSVETGAVRVLGPRGEVVIESLGAGRQWSVPPETHGVAGPPDPADQPDGGAETADPPDGGPKPAAKPRPPAPAASGSLRRARNALARGDVRAARRHVDAVLAANPTRVQRAEARTIVAECALVAGEPARAARLYVAVADRFRDLPAGENALFAAARLRDHTSKAAAGRLYRLYLERYPSGRFRAEARAALEAVGENK